ncbi:hypothetical protein MTBUT4_240045 [Magnetospirillum sp. UT-4]|nr:hypothetical protein MTBUT4_240045 [Magnetospirillum sp. UT-4]
MGRAGVGGVDVCQGGRQPHPRPLPMKGEGSPYPVPNRPAY